MSEGGFLVRFMDKEKEVEKYRCYEVSFQFDAWTYKLNNEEKKRIPGITKIEVVPEEAF